MGILTLNNRREGILNNGLVATIGILFFILATTLGAYVRIPIAAGPVPITLQTFFVLLSGAILGRRCGSFSQLAYVILGAAGLPVFQNYSFGASYLLGPTGGYILGFIFAAYVVGRIIEYRPMRTGWVIASFAIGNVVIYAFGIIWLMYLLKMDIAKAITIGALPFIPGDIAKILLAALIYSRISRRTRDIFPV